MLMCFLSGATASAIYFHNKGAVKKMNYITEQIHLENATIADVAEIGAVLGINNEEAYREVIKAGIAVLKNPANFPANTTATAAPVPTVDQAAIDAQAAADAVAAQDAAIAKAQAELSAAIAAKAAQPAV